MTLTAFAGALAGCTPSPARPSGREASHSSSRSAAQPERASKRAEAYFQAGLEFASGGRLRAAVGAFQRSSQLDPQRYDAHYQAGRCYYELGQYELEIAEYTYAHAVNPAYPPVWRALGNAYLASDDLEGAQQAYRQYLKVAPPHAEVLYNLALVEADLGHFAEARALWQRVVKLREQRGADARTGKSLRVLAGERLEELKRRASIG